MGILDGKKHFLNLCHLLRKDRVLFQTNLLKPCWLGVLLPFFFFLSRFSLAKVVMVVLRFGWINRSDALLHSDTNICRFSSLHLNKVKRYFSAFFGACVPVLMLNRKSLLSYFEKGFTITLMIFFNLLRWFCSALILDACNSSDSWSTSTGTSANDFPVLLTLKPPSVKTFADQFDLFLNWQGRRNTRTSNDHNCDGLS